VTPGEFDLNEDLAAVDAATKLADGEFPEGNKIADEIEMFLGDIGYTTGGGVDDTELRAYLNPS